MSWLPKAIAQPSLTAVGSHQWCEVMAGDQLRYLRPTEQGIKEGRIDRLQLISIDPLALKQSRKVNTVLNQALALQETHGQPWRPGWRLR